MFSVSLKETSVIIFFGATSRISFVFVNAGSSDAFSTVSILYASLSSRSTNLHRILQGILAAAKHVAVDRGQRMGVFLRDHDEGKRETEKHVRNTSQNSSAETGRFITICVIGLSSFAIWVMNSRASRL